MRYLAILNRDGGTLRTMDLDMFCSKARSIFEAEGHSFRYRLIAGADIVPELEAAASTGDVDVVLAGGGDGTISAAAGIAFQTQIPLAVLPAGTMNLFARSLKVPLELDEALYAIARGGVGEVDIATANGRSFVHQFSVGIHARLVRTRERLTYRSRTGKILASLRAITSAAINPPRFDVEIHTAKGTERRKTSGISVSNNPFGSGHIPHADELNAGMLGVYVARVLSTRELVRLSVDIMLGTWHDNPMVAESMVREMKMRFPRRKHDAMAVIDGELVELEPEVNVRLHPGALKVILPKVEVPIQPA